MKIIKEKVSVTKADITLGQFNNGEHLLLEIEPSAYQTVSCRLPNGAFVTFAFVPGEGNEMECVDVHSTVGKLFKYGARDGADDVHYIQHAIGFSRNGDTFDTREVPKPTGLLTLLLGKQHHISK